MEQRQNAANAANDRGVFRNQREVQNQELRPRYGGIFEYCFAPLFENKDILFHTQSNNFGDRAEDFSVTQALIYNFCNSETNLGINLQTTPGSGYHELIEEKAQQFEANFSADETLLKEILRLVLLQAESKQEDFNCKIIQLLNQITQLRDAKANNFVNRNKIVNALVKFIRDSAERVGVKIDSEMDGKSENDVESRNMQQALIFVGILRLVVSKNKKMIQFFMRTLFFKEEFETKGSNVFAD